MSRRRVVAVALVAGVAAAAPVIAASGRGRYVAAPAVCGTARSPVKTLTDAAAASLDTKPATTTVLGLSTLQAPPHVGNTLARQSAFGGVKFKTNTINV